MDTCTVTLVRYSGPFLKWTREELKRIEQRARKLMTLHKALYSKDDVDRLYVSRKGGIGLGSIEDSVDESIQRLEHYIKKPGGRLIAATINNTNDTRTNGTTITRKQKWKDKQRFKRQTNDFSHEKNVDVAKKR